MSATDWPALLPDVARRLLGEPPRIEAGGATWRYRGRGSLAVHVGGARAGTWRDHEAGAGGGTLALIEHAAQTDKAGALAWLVDARLIAAPGGPEARPANRGIPCHNSRSAPMRPDSGPAAPGSPPDRALSGPSRRSREQSGTWTPPESAAPALAPPAPTPSVTADVARAVLQNADEADATPARAYLAARGTWPADGPALPAAVRWLPPEAVADLPTWPDRDGRPLRLTPPADVQPGAVRSLHGPPVPPCGAVVFELARPGCAPDAVTLSPVTADGRRLPWPGRAGGNKRTLGNGAGRILEVAALPGDGWPDAGAAPLVVAVVEGEADALALARLRLPGVLIRAAGGTSGMIGGAAVLTDLPAATAACLVSDGDPPGRAAVAKLHAALQNAGRTCYAAVLLGGDLDEVLRGAIDVDLAAQHAERAAIYEYDGGLPRPAATARALARLLEQLSRREHD